MSRSHRKTPVYANTAAPSEKDDKRIAHQAQRSHFRTELGSTANVADIDFDERNIAHSENRLFAKDGKTWVGLQAERVGHALRILTRPARMKSDRAAKRALSK